MISCEQAELFMSLHIDEQLDEKSTELLETHISGCADCAQKHSQYREMIGILKNAPQPELPETFHASLMARLSVQKTGIIKKKQRYEMNRLAAAAAGMVFALFILSAVVTGMSAISGLVARQANNDTIQQSAADVMVASGTSEGDATRFYESAADENMEAARSPSSEYGLILADIDNAIDTSYAVSTTSSDTAVKKIYDVSLRVSSVDEVVRIINTLGGYNTNANVNYSGVYQNGNIVRRVRNDQYPAVIETLRNLGEVIYETESEEILTGYKLDNIARLRAKEEERERLFDLLDKSRTMDVMVMVEGRLSIVENEIDNYKSTLLSLEQSASEPIIYINLVASRTMQEEDDTESFAKRIKSSFIGSLNTTIRFMENLIIFITAAILPILLIVAFAVPVLFILTKKMKKNRISGEPHKIDDLDSHSGGDWHDK